MRHYDTDRPLLDLLDFSPVRVYHWTDYLSSASVFIGDGAPSEVVEPIRIGHRRSAGSENHELRRETRALAESARRAYGRPGRRR